MDIAVVFTNRDVFAGTEGMGPEAVAHFIIVHPVLVVIEDPARVLGPAWFMHQAADLIRSAIPKPTHPAMVAMFAPKFGIDVATCINWGDEFVAMARRYLPGIPPSALDAV